ncbi:MAG: hypothetical protein HYT69_01255 [Candidatus Zambryskibacteria bacterium]|nr:hypothetical protein [Candidatus Zambryskibacteria bacterium]
MNPTEYTLLEKLPLGPANELVQTVTTATYIPGLFRLIIGIAGVLAVVRIIFGGIKYMSTDAFSGKNEAKGVIENALWGLLLAMAAWLIVYTINPGLVNFNLNIPVQEIATSTLGGGGGVGTGCQGNCPFSYVNSSGVTVRYRNCSSCSNANSFGLSIKNQIVNGTQAQMNTDLGNKLKAMRDTSGNPSFQVTETWPPTVNHASQAQYDGTSVDVSLLNPTASSIATFANNAKAKGLRVEYEVATEVKRQAYISAGLPFGVTIIVVPYISGEHFSVYMN